MNNTILSVISGYAVTKSNRIAVISNKEQLTYSEFWKEICRAAHFFRENGINKGDLVAIKAAQSSSYLICYYGLQLAGAVPCALEQNMPSSSTVQVALKLKTVAVISERIAINDLPDNLKYFSMQEIRSKSTSLADDMSGLEFPSENDTQIIMFTTGTTGASKGVEISFKAMAASEQKIADFLDMKYYAEHGVFITPTPLNHAKGIWETGGMLRSGGTVYILRGMADLKAYFKALDYPCEKLVLSLVPANLRILITMVPDEFAKYADKIGDIKLGTAPLLEHDKELAMKLLPNTNFHNAYGSSEAGILSNLVFNKHKGLEYCIGQLLPNNEAIVVDDERKPIKSSKENMGKLAFRSNSVMKGYYNEPELTAEILEDGIVYTNDFGYVDENGFVFVRGRADDVINTGGLKVAPEEVESAAIRIEGIKDCICIAEKNELYGNSLKLLVVMKEKGTMDAYEIRRQLSHSLEPYKTPNKIEEVDEVARTYNGKMNRKFYR